WLASWFTAYSGPNESETLEAGRQETLGDTDQPPPPCSPENEAEPSIPTVNALRPSLCHPPKSSAAAGLRITGPPRVARELARAPWAKNPAQALMKLRKVTLVLFHTPPPVRLPSKSQRPNVATLIRARLYQLPGVVHWYPEATCALSRSAWPMKPRSLLS